MVYFFRNLGKGISLSKKLVLMFMALSMTPIFIVGLISANVSSHIVKEKEIERRTEELTLVEKEIFEIIREIDRAAIRYGLDPNVQCLFSNEDNISKYDRKMMQFEIEKLIFDGSQKLYYWVNSSCLLSNTGDIYSSRKNAEVTLDKYYENDWFAQNMACGSVRFFGNTQTVNNQKIIPYVRQIKDLSSNKSIGIVVTNINESSIRATYTTRFPSNTGDNMIVSNRGTILSHTDKQYIGRRVKDVYGFDPNLIDKNYYEYACMGQKMLFIQNKDAKIGWTYYSIVPLNEVLVGAAMINRVTFLLIATCISFCVFISYFLSRRVTRPINQLSDIMREAETGNLDVQYHVRHYDEIGKLGDSFNTMIKKLKTSMEETINVQKEKMAAELKGLEFQINPHFLYNTLSSIIWLADEGRNDDVIRITKSLATFFRISISRGKEMIRISEEVEHVINYMEIQKLRYGEVTFVHDVHMEIKGFYTLKLLLQPIIENAIYHGVKLLTDEPGIIKLEGQRHGDDVVFKVSDNGKGMTQARADYINQALSECQKGDFGVGLKNVNDRIRLHFGDRYGLYFLVDEGWTVVEIRLPVIESEEGLHV